MAWYSYRPQEGGRLYDKLILKKRRKKKKGELALQPFLYIHKGRFQLGYFAEILNA